MRRRNGRRSLAPRHLAVLAIVVTAASASGRPATPDFSIAIRGEEWKVPASALAEPIDASRAAAHTTLLELLPNDQTATRVARRSGSWLDPATWGNEDPPGRGAIVRIPEGIVVDFLGGATAPLFVVRVDGTLRLGAPERAETRLIVDTLVATASSELSVLASEPGSGRVEIEIRPFDIEAHEAAGAPGWSRAAIAHYSDGAEVRDTASGTRSPADSPAVDDGAGVLGRWRWDPLQLSLGIVSHGAVRMAGRPKTARVAVAEARAGDRTLTARTAPAGWEVGDRLVVTSAGYVGRDPDSGAYVGSEDELRRLEAVDGRELRLDAPLSHDHVPPRARLSAYAVNLSRNVLIHSSIDQPLDDLDADRVGAVASRLGHVMFLHTEDVRLHHVAFDDLGRTNKNEASDDHRRWGNDAPYASRRRDEQAGDYQRTRPNRMTNPRGRYAMHFHHAGARASDATALVEGSVVTGGPGWGFVSHDSRVDFRDNVAFGVLGAGFVAETGNETGVWEGNTAINTYGAAYNDPSLDPQGRPWADDDFDGVVLREKQGAWKSHDFGHYGNGFWLQGKVIELRDNVSVSSGLWGYFFMFRGPDQKLVPPEVLPEPLAVHSPNGIHPSAPALDVFVDNESIADRGGLIMIGLGGGRTSDERTVVRRFRAWEVGQTGTRAQYYPVYTIRDSTFLASDRPAANPLEGVLLDKVQVDTVLAHLEIEGFRTRYRLRKLWSPGPELSHGFEAPEVVRQRALAAGEPDPAPLGYAHVVIDGGFTREQAAEPRFMGDTYRPEDTILTSGELVPGRFEIRLDDDSLRVDLDRREIAYGELPDDPIRPTLQEGHVLMLEGLKRDSIGEIPIRYLNNELVWHPDAVEHRLATQGYYRMPNGSRGVLLEELFSDRYTGERHIVRFVAELDPRWEVDAYRDLGAFDPELHPDVHVPAFLLGE